MKQTAKKVANAETGLIAPESKMPLSQVATQIESMYNADNDSFQMENSGSFYKFTLGETVCLVLSHMTTTPNFNNEDETDITAVLVDGQGTSFYNKDAVLVSTGKKLEEQGRLPIGIRVFYEKDVKGEKGQYRDLKIYTPKSL